jgi:hypothetical protein
LSEGILIFSLEDMKEQVDIEKSNAHSFKALYKISNVKIELSNSTVHSITGIDLKDY